MSVKLITLFAIGALVAPFSASAASFSECPAVGNDTLGCELLITVTAVSSTGVATAFSVATASPDQGPFDGADDTLVGILNSSGSSLTSIGLSSSLDIFGFDGDGACSGDYGVIPGCAGSTDTTGYAPAGVTFSGINAAATAGTINFAGGLSSAGSTWFSLEEAITANQISPTTTPEPSSALLLCAGLFSIGAATFRRPRATV